MRGSLNNDPRRTAGRTPRGENAAPIPPSAQTPLPPSAWTTQNLAFTPDETQAQILDQPSSRLMLCCVRQWGKSTLAAAKALILENNSLFPEHPLAAIGSARYDVPDRIGKSMGGIRA